MNNVVRLRPDYDKIDDLDLQARELARGGGGGDNGNMNTPTREEFEARIEAAEARSDSRFIAFEKAIGDAVSLIKLEMQDMKGELKAMHAEIQPLKGLRSTIITTGVVTGLGVVGLVLAIMTYGSATFDSGREISRAMADAQAQSARAQTETAAALSEMRQIVQEMKAAQAPPSPPGPQAQ